MLLGVLLERKCKFFLFDLYDGKFIIQYDYDMQMWSVVGRVVEDCIVTWSMDSSQIDVKIMTSKFTENYFFGMWHCVVWYCADISVTWWLHCKGTMTEAVGCSEMSIYVWYCTASHSRMPESLATPPRYSNCDRILHSLLGKTQKVQ
jgi:hypothetical protein